MIPAGTRNHFALDLGLDREDPTKSLDALTDGVELRIGQVVTGRPEGEVAYVLDCRHGACALIRGSVDDADVVFTSDISTATELADGGAGPAAGHLVLSGDVRVSGDVPQLLTAGDLPARLAAAIAALGSPT